jgi:hypothetical protein
MSQVPLARCLAPKYCTRCVLALSKDRRSVVPPGKRNLAFSGTDRFASGEHPSTRVQNGANLNQ